MKWVYDGDTLLLSDKRKIRIIGIDTPEVKHHQQKAQAYGAKAREALRELLKKYDYRISLKYGKEKKDKYSRILAHVYLPDGTNISNWMLKNGYARTMSIPPNIQLADCYKQAEVAAQNQSLKIWRFKKHQIKAAKSLPQHTTGYIRLKGMIKNIKRHKKSLVMEFESNTKSHIQIKIKKHNLHYFENLDPDRLRDETIVVSGILKKKYGKRTIYLNYPTQLRVIQRMNGVQARNHEPNNKHVQTNKSTATIKWSLQNED